MMDPSEDDYGMQKTEAYNLRRVKVKECELTNEIKGRRKYVMLKESLRL